MKAENAEDMVRHLEELWLASPLLQKAVLEAEGLEEMKVKGQLYTPYGDRLQFDYAIKAAADGAFEVNSYNVLLIEVPPIDHTSDAILNTEQLEQRLKEVNWNQDIDEIMTRYLNADALIFEVIMLKIFNPEIAGQFMAKFWAGTPMEQQPFYEAMTDFLPQKERSFPITGDYSDFDIIEAYNLMKGRSVMKSELLEGELTLATTAHWFVLEGQDLIKLPDYDIDAQVRRLSLKDPLTQESYLELMTALCKGESVPITILTQNRLLEGRLHADPKNTTLRFLDNDGKEIPLKEISEKPTEVIKTAKTGKPKVAAKNKTKGRRHL